VGLRKSTNDFEKAGFPAVIQTYVYKLVTVSAQCVHLLLLLLLLLLLYDMDVPCHGPFLPGISLEPAVIPTAQASSFTLQYFPYYV
jgi:hypothetical protein